MRDPDQAEALVPDARPRGDPGRDRARLRDYEGPVRHRRDADLEAIERSDDSRSIEIRSFVPGESVDAIYFDRHYYLVPGSNAAQRRPYVLLLEAMRETKTAALGRFVRAGRESLCLVRAQGDALSLETLFVARTSTRRPRSRKRSRRRR